MVWDQVVIGESVELPRSQMKLPFGVQQLRLKALETELHGYILYQMHYMRSLVHVIAGINIVLLLEPVLGNFEIDLNLLFISYISVSLLQVDRLKSPSGSLVILLRGLPSRKLSFELGQLFVEEQCVLTSQLFNSIFRNFNDYFTVHAIKLLSKMVHVSL